MGPSPRTRQQRFEALFDAHYRDVHRYALRRIDVRTAEEIANETFMICWRKLDAVPDPALPWLYAVARKCLANRRRGTARDEALKHFATGVATGRDPAERFAERDVILRAFTGLHERDRDVLRLVAWEGLGMADAARAAGISRPAFAMRLHRARRRLAARLEEQEAGVPQPSVDCALEDT